MAWTSCWVIRFRIEALVGMLAVFHAGLLFCPHKKTATAEGEDEKSSGEDK